MILATRVLLCITGSILLGLSLLVYEDEERKIQSRLENYWIWLDERRVQSYAMEDSILSRLSSRLSQLLDDIFGHRIISIKAVIISTSLSVATFLTVLLLMVHLSHLPSAGSVEVVLYGVVVWNLFCIFLARHKQLVALVCWGAPFLIVVLYLLTTKSRPGEQVSDLTIFFGGLLASLFTDLLIIAASRRLVRQAALVRSTSKLLLVGLTGLALLVVVSVLPALLAVSNFLDRHLHPERRVYYRLSQGLALLNASDLVFLAILMFVIGILVVHHTFWPLLQRPLYALQRTGITAGRKTAASVGILMISTGLGLTPLIEGIKKILGA